MASAKVPSSRPRSRATSPGSTSCST